MENNQLLLINNTYTKNTYNWNNNWIIELAGFKNNIKHLLSFGNILLEIDENSNYIIFNNKIQDKLPILNNNWFKLSLNRNNKTLPH